MAYQVIARRWRSKIFSELVGQEAIAQTLRNALKSGRMPHALLLTGPRGTGKTSTARILAKSLRCPNAKDFEPCNQCDECQLIDSSRSVDVIEIDGASNNGVDAVRELRDTVGYMPSHGSKKLYIIDEVHMLSTSAFNALLKTLEEPPPHVIFVMATTEVQKIPDTILSRCQRFDFRRIPTRQIADHLEKICQADKIKAEPEALWMIARHGSGSMRDSQSLLDQVLTYADGKITLQTTIDSLGLTDRSLIIAVLRALVERDTKQTLAAVKSIIHSGQDPKVFLNELIEEIRHLLMIKISSQLVDLPESEIQSLRELGQALSSEDIHLLFDMAIKGAHDLVRLDDTRIVLEMVLLRMAGAPRIQNLLNMSLAPATTAAQVAPTATARPTNTGPVQNHAPTGVQVPMAASGNANWGDFVARVKKVNGLVGAQLENTFLKSFAANTVTIGVPQKLKFIQAKLAEPDFQRKVVNYLNTFWGQGVQLKVELDDSTESKPGPTASTTPKSQQEQKVRDEEQSVRKQVENHPLVKSTQGIFKSQIGNIKGEQK